MAATQQQIDARFRSWRSRKPEDGGVFENECYTAGYRAAEMRAAKALAQAKIARLEAAVAAAKTN